jgi:hypothetical protein
MSSRPYYDVELLDAMLDLPDLDNYYPRHDDGDELRVSARDRLAAIRAHLESEHGFQKAHNILDRHFKKVKRMRASRWTVTPGQRELEVVEKLAGLLRRADEGAIPTASRIEHLIESLKAYAPFFKGIPNSERERLANSEEIRPMRNVALWLSKQEEGDRSKWHKIHTETLMDVARFIFDHELFFGEKVRVARWNKHPRSVGAPEVAAGRDKSSSLFVVERE